MTAVPFQAGSHFAIWREVQAPDRAGQRDALELALVEGEPVTLHFAGHRQTLSPGHIAAFWGLMPHHFFAPAPDAELHRVSVRLEDFLQWEMPRAFTGAILSGNLICASARGGFDLPLLRQWQRDLLADDASSRIAMLELETRLFRFARAAFDCSADPRLETPELGAVAAMARCIARSYTEPLRVADIARAARLSAHYAERLFAKACGMSLHECLNRHRLAHARRLLATTDASIIDVAFNSGFGSLGRFYANFTRECGASPRRFRKRRR